MNKEGFNIELVRAIVKAAQSDPTIEEIEVKLGKDIHIRAKFGRSTIVRSPENIDSKSAQRQTPDSEYEDEQRFYKLLAPLTGTFYAQSLPEKPPFVREGDFIETGTTIGIIEAMKVMNEIASLESGQVVKILVQDRALVNQGQPLMIIDKIVKKSDVARSTLV